MIARPEGVILVGDSVIHPKNILSVINTEPARAGRESIRSVRGAVIFIRRTLT